MMEFDSDKFERKLLNLKDTQDSITGLSKWCLSKHAAHKPIVKSWLKILKEGKLEIINFSLLDLLTFYLFSQNRTTFVAFLSCQ